MILEQNTLGEIDPLVEVRHLLPECVDLGQKLGVLGWLGMAA